MLTKTVLVVEDDPGLRPLIQRVLGANEIQALCAATAHEALRIWEQTGKAIPVALVDLTLPDAISGEALARKLQADSPKLRIVLTSGQLSLSGVLSSLGFP